MAVSDSGWIPAPPPLDRHGRDRRHDRRDEEHLGHRADVLAPERAQIVREDHGDPEESEHHAARGRRGQALGGQGEVREPGHEQRVGRE